MPDQSNPKPSFIDNLSNLVSDIASDANRELIQKAWFDSPFTHDMRLADYYQGALNAKEELGPSMGSGGARDVDKAGAGNERDKEGASGPDLDR